MPYQTRWLGLSLLLHLALGAAFIHATSRRVERTPRVITVTLEDLALPQVPRPAKEVAAKRAPDTATVTARHTPVPASEAPPVPRELPRQAPQPEFLLKP